MHWGPVLEQIFSTQLWEFLPSLNFFCIKDLNDFEDGGGPNISPFFLMAVKIGGNEVLDKFGEMFFAIDLKDLLPLELERSFFLYDF